MKSRKHLGFAFVAVAATGAGNTGGAVTISATVQARVGLHRAVWG